MNSARALTFATLDGLAFAAERGRLDARDRSLFADGALGPLIEWYLLNEAGLLPAPDTAPWLSLGAAAPMMSALRNGRKVWLCPETRATGLFRMPGRSPENDTDWVGFGLAAQKAANAVGFHRQIAAQFVGAIGEMVSNIYEHSNAPRTGVVAFRADGTGFEFVVADRGVGILESLRSCPDFRDLCDDGIALQMALNDGVSRFGRAALRGHGFRPIFIGLANLSALLRFRSGDHALIIDGHRIDMMAAKTAQKARIKGFIASVHCRRPTRLQ